MGSFFMADFMKEEKKSFSIAVPEVCFLSISIKSQLGIEWTLLDFWGKIKSSLESIASHLLIIFTLAKTREAATFNTDFPIENFSSQ